MADCEAEGSAPDEGRRENPSHHSPDADERAEAAERQVLQREHLNSQSRAEFYEANDPASAHPTGWQLVSLPAIAPLKEGTTETPISIADLMRPKV